MNNTFRWNLFWKTTGVLILVIVLNGILNSFGGLVFTSTYSMVVAFLFVLALVALVLIIMKHYDLLTAVGCLAFLSIVPQLIYILSGDMVIYIVSAIISFLLVTLFLSWKKLYEVMWSLILVVLTIIMFFAVVIVELIINPPSEE